MPIVSSFARLQRQPLANCVGIGTHYFGLNGTVTSAFVRLAEAV
jgi:hypothetical protein